MAHCFAVGSWIQHVAAGNVEPRRGRWLGGNPGSLVNNDRARLWSFVFESLKQPTNGFENSTERISTMTSLYAQGDLLIERVADLPPSGVVIGPAADGATVLAEGEATGHRHAIFDRVTMFRDDGLARDIPAELYVGHVRVDGASARLEHNEHAAIALPRGTYRIRRQRELEPQDARIVVD
jgi:hypothetical protein